MDEGEKSVKEEAEKKVITEASEDPGKGAELEEFNNVC